MCTTATPPRSPGLYVGPGLAAWGFLRVHLRQAGYVANRLQAAFYREVAHLATGRNSVLRVAQHVRMGVAA